MKVWYIGNDGSSGVPSSSSRSGLWGRWEDSEGTSSPASSSSLREFEKKRVRFLRLRFSASPGHVCDGLVRLVFRKMEATDGIFQSAIRSSPGPSRPRPSETTRHLRVRKMTYTSG